MMPARTFLKRSVFVLASPFMKRGGLALVMVAVATLAIPGRAGADPISVGGTLSPVPTDGTYLGPTVATIDRTFSIGAGATGEIAENVIIDSMNPFGAGDYTFVFQLVDDSGDGDIDTVGLSSFGSLSLDVVQLAGGVGATSADRLTPGVINFTLPGLTPISETPIIIVRTPATSFVSGSILIGGDNSDNTPESTTVTGFAPAAPAPVPEPGSMVLLGTGLAFGARQWRKRRSR